MWFVLILFIILYISVIIISSAGLGPGAHHPRRPDGRSSFRPTSKRKNIIPDLMIIDNNYNIYRPAAANCARRAEAAASRSRVDYPLYR